MPQKQTWNVSRYLAARLRQLGVEHLFGIPGNHLGFFLEEIHRKKGEPAKPWHLEWVGEPMEMTAGYAADGYARIKGVGAVAVTYGVGALSLLNTTAGSYVEMLPVVVINGAPKTEAHLNYDAVGFLTSHMSPRRESNLNAFRQVTVAAEAITNARRAPSQIDAALAAAISERRPVYLEIFEDVFEQECPAPTGAIVPTPPRGDAKRCCEAVNAVLRILPREGKTKVILWGGIELIRMGLADRFVELSAKTGLQFLTSLMGKSLAPETHPNFAGVYNGKASDPTIREIFEKAPVRIGIGAWTTSKNLEGIKVWGIDNTVLASHRGVRVNQQYFPNVDLGDFIDLLGEQLQEPKFRDRWEPYPFIDLYLQASATAVPIAKKSRRRAYLSLFAEPPSEAASALTYDSFFAVINGFLNPGLAADDARQQTRSTAWPWTVVSDAGFSLIGAQSIHTPEANTFFSQTSWLAIGWSAGAVTGIKAARPAKRPFVFIGEGSFQETCQAVSTHVRLGHNSVIWVLNNGDFYGIEQMLVEPAYYKPDPSKLHYYNELHPWNYDRLADVFGNGPDAPPQRRMTGFRVTTHADLTRVLRILGEPRSPVNRGPVIVQVVLPRLSYPKAIRYRIHEISKPCIPGAE